LEDLGHYGRSFDLSASTEKTGLFNQKDFDVVSYADFERARKSIVIFSGFITEQRVAVYESIFRRKVIQGVKIRCVTRPPNRNGSIPEENGKAALNGLEIFGCVVDTRGDIHEKVVIIDDEIVWFGSLNPLSHTAKTAEVMARVVGKQIALQLVSFLALDKGIRQDEAEGISTRKENPKCPKCGARVAFMKGRFGHYWECEDCERRENVEKQKKSERATTNLGSQEAPMCPECGAPTNPRTGPYGAFYGCSRYPNCSGTVNNKGQRSKKKKNGT
jgi:ssDNA-binding Zn-finger/Zn-ribbon topoisomerase 1